MAMRTRSMTKEEDMAQANKTKETRQEFFQEHSSPNLARRSLRNKVQSKARKPEAGPKGGDVSSGSDEPDWMGGYVKKGTEDDRSNRSHGRPKRREGKVQPEARNQQLLSKTQRKYAVKSSRELHQTAKLTKEKASVITRPKMTNSDRDEMKKDSKCCQSIVFAFSIVLVALIVAQVYKYRYLFISADAVEPEMRPNFGQSMQELRSLFPAQRKHIWDMVEMMVEDHLSQGAEPIAPIVLMFGSQPDAAESNKCLAKQLGSVLGKTLSPKHPGVILIDGRDFADWKAHTAKEEIDSRLRKGFESGRKVAIVLNLDALPPCSILLFHSYCENDDARYKDAVLIFTVALDAERDESRAKPVDLKAQEDLITEHLLRMWVNKCDKLPQEKVEAMLSRVANNVGVVQREKSVAC